MPVDASVSALRGCVGPLGSLGYLGKSKRSEIRFTKYVCQAGNSQWQGDGRWRKGSPVTSNGGGGGGGGGGGDGTFLLIWSVH